VRLIAKKQWLPEDIRNVRKRFRLSQRELSYVLGSLQQTISEWETGKFLPGKAYCFVLDQAEAELSRLYNQAEGDWDLFFKLVRDYYELPNLPRRKSLYSPRRKSAG
jgi:DNA-binding XRE family transcriptional regulator